MRESTTYPGTTEDFYVGYSPEHIDPGNKTWTFVNTPKEAQRTKLLENTFRFVELNEQTVGRADAAVVVTPHSGLDL